MKTTKSTKRSYRVTHFEICVTNENVDPADWHEIACAPPLADDYVPEAEVFLAEGEARKVLSARLAEAGGSINPDDFCVMQVTVQYQEI